MKRILIIITVAVIAVACHSTTYIPATPQNITNAIDSSNWVFTPNTVRPQYGRVKNENSSGFGVQYRQDRLTVYLPYYGRAYGGADVISGRGPLDFSSVNFATDKKHPKEGEWQVSITPKDNNEVRLMNFTLFSNGTASLQVTMTNRSAIGYDGFVAPAK